MDAKYWISAHDEVKEKSGIATKWIESRTYEIEEVVRMLRRIDGVMGDKGKKTIVEVLGCGGVRSLRG